MTATILIAPLVVYLLVGAILCVRGNLAVNMAYETAIGHTRHILQRTSMESQCVPLGAARRGDSSVAGISFWRLRG